MSCDGRSDQIFEYLTETLDPTDRENLESHLASGCPRCHKDLTEVREALDAVLFSVPPEPPSPSACQRLMDRVHCEADEAGIEARLNHHRSGVAPRGAAMPQGNGSAGAFDSKPTTVPQRHRSIGRRRHLVTQTLSHALAAIVAVVATIGLMSAELRQNREQFNQLADEVAGLNESLVHSQERMAELESIQTQSGDLWDLLQSHDSHFVQLTGGGNDRSYWCQLIMDPERGLGYFIPGDPFPFARDQRYSLWLKPDENGEPIQAAEFTFLERRPMLIELRLPDGEPRRYHEVSIKQLESHDESGDASPSREVLFGEIGRPRL